MMFVQFGVVGHNNECDCIIDKESPYLGGGLYMISALLEATLQSSY